MAAAVEATPLRATREAVSPGGLLGVGGVPRKQPAGRREGGREGSQQPRLVLRSPSPNPHGETQTHRLEAAPEESPKRAPEHIHSTQIPPPSSQGREENKGRAGGIIPSSAHTHTHWGGPQHGLCHRAPEPLVPRLVIT